MTAAGVDERSPLPGPTWPPSAPPPASFPLTDRRAVLADDPCEAGFSGGDPEYAGMYLHARYFDPQLGIFLSPDPIGVEGGMNLYGYGLGNPIAMTDRSGLYASSCVEWYDELCFKDTSVEDTHWSEFYELISHPGNIHAAWGNPLAGMIGESYDEFQAQLAAKGQGTLFTIYDENGTAIGMSVDPSSTNEDLCRANSASCTSGRALSNLYLSESTGVALVVSTRDLHLRLAANGVSDVARNELCHYACSPDMPDVAKPYVWWGVDAPWARAEKAVFIGAGNAAAQVGATGVEIVLFPIRRYWPHLIGDPRLREHTTWYAVQGGFNDVWRKFVLPPPGPHH